MGRQEDRQKRGMEDKRIGREENWRKDEEKRRGLEEKRIEEKRKGRRLETMVGKKNKRRKTRI